MINRHKLIPLFLSVLCLAACPDIEMPSDDDDTTDNFCRENWVEVPDSRVPGQLVCLFSFYDTLDSIEGPEIETPLGPNSREFLFFPWDKVQEHSDWTFENIQLTDMFFEFDVDDESQVQMENIFGQFEIGLRYLNPRGFSYTDALGDDEYEFDGGSLIFTGLNLFAARAGVETLQIVEASYSPYYFYLTTPTFPDTRFKFIHGLGPLPP